MANIPKIRDTLKDSSDPSVFLKIKMSEGSFVDERSSWIFWDDANETLYAICLPDNSVVDTVYTYTAGTHIDLANYQGALKSSSRMFMVYAYTYENIIGIQTVYNEKMTENLMDKFVTTLSGDEKEKLLETKEKFKAACANINNPDTYLAGDYGNTNKDYMVGTMY